MSIKLKIKVLSSIIFVITLFSCSGNSFNKLSVENPKKLIQMQDSLLSNNVNNSKLLHALANAHINVAKKYLNENQFDVALNHFKESSKFNENNIYSKYGILISEGQILIQKGNKNGIWDAIEKYSQAATLFPDEGEPYYLIGVAYTKLSDKDFDLILESFEKALSLNLDTALKLKVEKRYNRVKNRKKNLDDFWK